MSRQSLAARGHGARRAALMHTKTPEAMTNRIPTKSTGGRSSRPSLMKIQVELQMTHRASQTRKAGRFKTLLPAAG